MGHKYKTIFLNKEEVKDFIDGDGSPIVLLNGLSSINVFVGSNNTGKSRFLRSILKIPKIKHRISEDITIFNQLDEISEELKEVVSQNSSVTSFGVRDTQFSTVQGSLLPTIQNFIEDELDNNILVDKYQSIYNTLLLGGYDFRGGMTPGPGNINQLELGVHSVLQKNKEILEKINSLRVRQDSYKKYFIPILRGLNNFKSYLGDRNHDIYKARILDNYAINEHEHQVTVFTGQGLYEEVQKMHNGDPIQRKRLKDFEKFLKEEIFEDKTVEIIPRNDTGLGVLYVKIGNDDEYPIYELGDGVQSIIILTFPLFASERSIFFVEEPEMHLHPGLQRKLLKVFKERSNHQYFLTTHSNHFLDLTLDYEDVSLFTFNKDDNTKKVEIKLVSPGDEAMLQLLGAQNSSVFLSNASVWVEGITDRLYLRKYLEVYQEDKNIKISEDTDYSFVEYGGDNITHWSFLNQEEYPINIDKLCAKSILIADSDGDKKMERKSELQASLGNRYKLLSVREIENTLSFEVIANVLEEYELRNKNSEFIMPTFSTRTAFKKTGLGSFIQSQIFKNQRSKRKGGYKADSGTVKDKVAFCKKAISYINKENITEEALDLAKFIYEFVLTQKQNRS